MISPQDAQTQVLSQILVNCGFKHCSGHSYPASAANCWNADWPVALNCRLWIMCATSMPCSVADAELKDLKPFICLVSFLMNLFCSHKCREYNARQKTKETNFSPTADRTNMEYWDRVNFAMELYLKCKTQDQDTWLQRYIDNPTTKRIICNPTLLKSSSNNIAKVCHHYVRRQYGVSIKDYYP